MKRLSFLLSIFIFTSYLFGQKEIDYYDLGMKRFNEGDYGIAIHYLEKVKKQVGLENNIYSSAHFFIGESLVGLEQIDGAISKFEEFLNQFPTSNFRDVVLYRLGNLYFDKGLFDKSRSKLTKLINEYPFSDYSGSAYYLIGNTFIEENNLDKAESFFNSAVNSKENNSFVDYSIYSLANLYEQKKQYRDAVKYYDKLLAFHKSSSLAPQAQLRIGVCYYYLKEYDNAILELSDPIIKNLGTDDQNEADYVLANAFYRLKEYKNSAEAYKRILDNSPKKEMLDRIRYGLAWINFKQGKYENAYKLFSLLSNSQNETVAIRSFFWSGEAKRYEGKYNEANKVFRAFVDKYPDHPYAEKVKLNIGISKFEQNSIEESEETLLESINSTDRIAKAKALTLLGEINLRKKKYRSAIEFLKRADLINNLPSQIIDRIKLALGVAYFFDGKNLEAIKNFNQINTSKTHVDKNKLNFYKAESYFYIGNYKEAINAYNKVSSDDENITKNTLWGKAYSYFNMKDFVKATYYFNEYIKNFPTSTNTAECYLRLADCYFGRKEFNKSVNYYERALLKSSDFKNDDRAFFNYSQALFKAGNSEKAIKTLEDFQIEFPASKYSDDSQYLIGWIQFQNGNFKDAISSYGKMFSSYPNSNLLPTAYYSIGDSYFNLGEYSKAIQNYEKVISEYMNSSAVFDAVNGIQYCYIVDDKQEKAINYLGNFIAEHPEFKYNDKIQFKKGEIFYSSGNYDKAIKEYKIFVDTYNESPLIQEAYYWIAKSAEQLNKYKESIKYFKESIDLFPNSEIGINSIIELGKIYRSRNVYNEEINLYNQYLPLIQKSKRITEVLFSKAESYIEQDSILSAYQTLNEVVDYRDGSLFYHKAEIELAMLELSRNEYESSLSLLKDVVKNRSDDIAAEAQYLIGLNYFEQEKMPESITELKKGRALFAAYDEWYTKTLLLLGDCYVRINNKKDAAEMYKAVIKKHRRDQFGKEAKSKLSKL